ncbi:hypothetical protein SH668x_000155 [Planctomicrobium sp. SH668]|uniref:hypothetical protein n=1 Tax=Planctomicrobium sp. SH668 TaxID=3448126 RepID=UPI003F5B3B3C
MPKEIKVKKSFGSVRVDHFSPKVPDGMPKALNVHISFEEAMRLHLGLGQALAKLNSYDRSTKEGKKSAVNLCVYLQAGRITINEGTVQNSSKPEVE